jgi:glycosyltransferase involved in cell wall biosynthesis
LISVIIPLYNKETFVGDSIQSVLDQTITDFEIIVIDDGSTDQSLSIIKELKDNRIRIISIANSGVSAARNRGVQESIYDWVAFIDADDWWAETFLEDFTKALKLYPRHNLFATGRSRVFNDKIERYQHSLLPKDGDIYPLNYFKIISKHLPPINASSGIIRKSHIVKHGGFRVGQRMHEDHDLWVRLSVENPVVFINKELSFYRKTEADTSSSKKYLAKDFEIYLTTILAVRNLITDVEKMDFKKYYNRFTLLVYIKNYRFYSKSDDKKVVSLAKQLVDGKGKWLLRFLELFPYKNTYRFFKILKK